MTKKIGQNSAGQQDGAEEESHEHACDVIPETSGQDLLLKVLTVLALIGLLAIGFGWSFSGLDLTCGEPSNQGNQHTE